MTSTTESVPSECLSLTVRGEWAHFRRVDGTVVKQTYRIIPRTTVAGLLAALVGADRDSYYEKFTIEDSAIAITPTSELRTTNIATNGVSTSKENLRRPRDTRKGRSTKGLQIRYPDSTSNRQQQNYEYLVDPAYRIDVAIEDSEFYADLKDHLQRGEFVYTPSLGLSECLAQVEFHGTFTPDPVQETDKNRMSVNSAVPNSVDAVVPNGRIETERSPAAMEAGANHGRTTTAFTTYAYTPSGDSIDVLLNPDLDGSVADVDGQRVMFV
jgi:CRISPR-associated protein Cas5h